MLSAALRLLVAAAGLLLAFPVVCAAQGDVPVARPAVKQGDRWIYRRTDNRTNKSAGTREERVTFANDATIHTVVVLFGKDQETDATYTSSWNNVSSFDGGVFSPDAGTLRFPLRAGDTYKADFENRRPRRGAFHVTHQRTAKVVGWEAVAVPAGKFRALKVEVEGGFKRLDTGLTGTTRLVLWYVPEVKRWVKAAYEDSFRRGPDSWYVDELIDYKVD
jgi:hypothetical protein